MSSENRAGDVAYVRTEPAPTLPPPASEVGLWGWLWRNVLRSMSNFSSPGAALQSTLMIMLTLGVGHFGIMQIWALVNFALVDAVWVAEDGVKRLACATTLQKGALPEDWFGACYPFIGAKWKFLIYGSYPATELWRVNIVLVIGALGVAWLIAEAVPRRMIVGAALILGGLGLGVVIAQMFDEPFGARSGVQILIGVGLIFLIPWREPPKRLVGVLMLTAYPLLAFILLTGGGLEVELTSLIIWGAVAAALIVAGVLGARGVLGELGVAFGGLASTLGYVIAAGALVAAVAAIDFGLVPVETNRWGGLLVTLVVAIVGIVFSLPLGVLLALGRRSSLPAVRYLSIAFIEFWRGVPLITVLFMASVMLPLFMPEGTDVNKLVRALIGVMLFAAAYQAEVVRGGLQAVPKGQYEGAMALGLSYWRMMGLIVLPQALTLVIPGIVNTFIGLFKDTTLVLIISLFDLLGAVQATFNDTEWATPVMASTGYFVVALMFWLFCFGMSRYSMYMERKLRKGRVR